MQIVALNDTGHLPRWRQPVVLLFLMAIAMPVSFNVWNALLNNFVIEVASFDGADIGWLHSVREVPGFLAVGVIALLLLIREQVLGLVSLALLGAATAVTAWFPSFGGILTITMLSSIGFHYYETVAQSLQLQWIDKKRAPQTLGWLISVGSLTTFVAYVLLVLTWKAFDLSYNFVYLAAGGFTFLVAVYCILAYPQFEAPNPQKRKMVLKRRYWLYYALQFMAGARRQIFIVFAGFMMVEKFGFEVNQLTGLYLINLAINIVLAPVFGKFVARFGERRALMFEYAGLAVVFFLYGGIYFFGWGVVLAMVLYIADHLFFALALALKTYFQKIADPEDIAPTAAVAFSINHISAVFLPVGLGYLWLTSPGAVYGLASAMALVSLALAALIPRHPVKGHETRLSRAPVAAE